MERCKGDRELYIKQDREMEGVGVVMIEELRREMEKYLIMKDG